MPESKLSSIIKKGGIAVIPTDTIYGMVGSALIPETVKRIYKLRKRNLKKPLIILISNLNDLEKFNIQISLEEKVFLKKIWPNPISVILPVPPAYRQARSHKWNYLHRGTNSLAFRIPKLLSLRNLLRQTGPLVAPSANLEGEKPAITIDEAKKYFGNQVDFYLDGGKIESEPSTLVELNSGRIKVLRNGLFKVTAGYIDP